FFAESAAVSGDLDALAQLSTAIGNGDAVAFQSFVATSAKLVSEIGIEASHRGVWVSVVPHEDCSEMVVHREKFPENYPSIDPDVIDLGKLLFFDPILSELQNRSCASCHKPELAFTDGRRFGLAANGSDLPRSTPTILNASLQHGLFWDARAKSL